MRVLDAVKERQQKEFTQTRFLPAGRQVLLRFSSIGKMKIHLRGATKGQLMIKSVAKAEAAKIGASVSKSIDPDKGKHRNFHFETDSPLRLIGGEAMLSLNKT